MSSHRIGGGIFRVVVFLALGSIFAVSSAHAQVIQSISSGLWSAPATWQRISGTGAIPGPADHVIVQAGHSVQLDTNSGISGLAWLEVYGGLFVADTQSYQLGVSRIEVYPAASFAIGTAAAPFQNNFTLTLTEAYLSNTYNSATENKTFQVDSGATLDLHGNGVAAGTSSVPGAALRPTWLKVQSGTNIPSGASSFQVDSTPFTSPGWNVGELMVIASTDFDSNQAEYRRIGSAAGTTLSFSTGLTYPHHGTIEAGLVDERAEVALLSRNLVIEGDTLSTTSRRGGQLRIQDSPAATARIQWTEFRYMGWYGAKGRYPVHFHEMGLATGSYFRFASVHHSFHRAISVHSTQGLLLEGNVACDNYGHTYYLETGAESANIFYNNLGLLTRKPDTLPSGVTALGQIWSVTGQPFFSAEEANPATYWILSYDNPFGFNTAAGSEGYGYWIEPANAAFLNPLPIPLPTFSDNTAHSNAIHGFFQDTARTYPLLVVSYPPLVVDVNQRMQIDNFTSYKNRQAGVWNRAYGETIWYNARVADNEFGFYLASEGIQQDYQNYLDVIAPYVASGASYYNYFLTQAPGMSIALLFDCKILGETQNLGFPTQPYETGWSPPRSLPSPFNPEYMIKGVELYDGLIGILGGTIRDFNDATFSPSVTMPGGTFNYRASAGVSMRGQHSVFLPGNFWCVDPRSLVWAVAFNNVTHPVLFPIPHPPSFFSPAGLTLSPNGVRDLALYDVDGSINSGSPNTYYTNNTTLLAPAGAPAATPLPGLPHYAAPLAVGGPGTNDNRAYGNLLLNIGTSVSPIWNQNPNVTALSNVSLTVGTAGRAPGPTSIYFLPMPGSLIQVYPSNVLLTTPGGLDEEYQYSYPAAASPANDPRNLEVRLRFSEQGRSAIVSVPYDRIGGTPPSRVEFKNAMDAQNSIPATVVTTSLGSLAALKASNGLAFYYDATNKRLYLKPTLYGPSHIPWLTAGNHPILSGREVICEVHS